MTAEQPETITDEAADGPWLPAAALVDGASALRAASRIGEDCEDVDCENDHHLINWMATTGDVVTDVEGDVGEIVRVVVAAAAPHIRAQSDAEIAHLRAQVALLTGKHFDGFGRELLRRARADERARVLAEVGETLTVLASPWGDLTLAAVRSVLRDVLGGTEGESRAAMSPATYAEVADALGVTEDVLRQEVRRLGLDRAPTGEGSGVKVGTATEPGRETAEIRTEPEEKR